MDQNLLPLFLETLKPQEAPAGAPASDDQLFDSLLWQESRGRQLDAKGQPVTSKKGAVGIAQVMPGTAPEAAKLAGLEYDEIKYRTDAEYNKALGRAYFNKQLEDFGGDKAKALAAYNAGPAALRRALTAAEKSGTPEAWLQYLPAETQSYVPTILNRSGKTPAMAAAGSKPAQWEDPYVSPKGDPREAPARSAMEAVADVVLGGAAGVVTGVGLVAGAFGADNAVAQGAEQISKDLTSLQSPARQFQREQRQETIRRADASGSTLAEIAAYGGALLEAPVETVMNAVGTSAPTLLISFIPGLNSTAAARLIAAGAMGAAQGAGAVKGAIYDTVYEQLKAAGVPDADAQKAAVGAQEYASKNGDQILIGAGLGSLAGTTGAEAVIGRILGQRAAQGAIGAGKAIVGGAIKEAIPEAAQGGQERLASNIALQHEGFDVPTDQGIIGQAVLEGMASAPLGGAAGFMERRDQAPAPTVAPELAKVAEKAQQPDTPLSRAALAGNTGPVAEAQRATAQQQQAAAAADAARPDPLLQRLDVIEGALRRPGSMDALRGEDSPSNPKEVMRDLATVKSPSARPDVREQAIARLEYALEWAGISLDGVAAPGEQQSVAAPTETASATAGAVDNLAVIAQAVRDPQSGLSDNDRARVRELHMQASNTALAPQLREQAAREAQEIVGRTMAASQPAATASAAPQGPALFAGAPPRTGTTTEGQAANVAAETRLQQLQEEDGQAAPDAPAPSVLAPSQQAEAGRAAQAANESAATRLAQVESEEQAAAAPAPTTTSRPDAVIAALSNLEQLRTAEERALVADAQKRYGAGGFALLQKAATTPGALSQAERAELERMRGVQAVGTPVGRQAAATAEAQQQPAMTDIAAPRVATPAGAGPAQIRQRRAQLRQILEMGLTQVQQTDAGWVMTDGRRRFRLGSPADVQLARTERRAFIDERANAAATSPKNDRKEPTGAQIDAVNWKKGDPIKLMPGVTFIVENPAGSVRKSKPGAAKPWQTTMRHHYGDIAGTKGADGDPIDAFYVGDGDKIFVIDQVNPDGKFDEHKVMFEVRDEASARQAYLANYEKGWTGLGAITEMTPEQLRSWKNDDVATKRPVGDLSGKTRRGAGTVPAAGAGTGGADARGSVVAAGAGPGRNDVGTGGDNPATGTGDRSGANGAVDHAGERAYVSVRVNGRKKVVPVVDVDKLGADSNSRTGGRAPMSRQTAELIRQIAAVFDKEVVLYENPDGELGDGFVMPSIDSTIFLNQSTTIQPLAVFGHELMHLLQRDNPQLHAALREVVLARVKKGGAKGFREDYYGGKEASDEQLNSDEAEELTSDLGGNLMSDPAFWREVMDEVQRQHPEEAKTLIAQLAAKLYALIDQLVAALRKTKMPGFRADEFVTDLQGIREAYRDALAQYVVDNGIRQTAVAAQVQRQKQSDARSSRSRSVTPTQVIARLKAGDGLRTGYTFSGTAIFDNGDEVSRDVMRKIRDKVLQDRNGNITLDPDVFQDLKQSNSSDIKRSKERDNSTDDVRPDSTGELGREPAAPAGEVPEYGKPREGAVSVLARHYGTQPRKELSSAAYGRGYKGGERDRAMEADDKRLRERIYFYVDQGNGIQPEAGVGPHAHEVRLNNIYDPRTRLVKTSGGANAFESAVIDAGFDGYLNPEFTTRQGAVVLLGKHNVPVKYIGMPAASAAPAAQAEPQNIKKGLLSRELREINVDAIPGAKIDGGNLVVPAESREQANAEMERIGSSVRFSASRLPSPQEQYAQVERKYRGTDEWLKAPNGAKTNLTERQWVHVRMPAFKEWFGDWEQFARDHGANGVWHDNDGAVSKAVDENGEPLVVYHGTDDAGFAAFWETGGKQRGDLGIWAAADLGMAKSYVRRGRARMVSEDDIDTEDAGNRKSGIYALFMNIRYATEENFDGAQWSGDKFDEDGKLQQDFGMGRTTDDVVREARNVFGADGAIIRNLSDDGGGAGYMGDPGDVFVTFDPNNVKSADFNNGAYSVSDDDIRFSSSRPGSDAGHKREISSGRYVGAPDWVGSSPQQLTALRKKLRQLAKEGEAGRLWYENSSKAILELAGGDKAEAEKIVGLIAIYSPNATVPANTSMALRAYFQWKAGVPIDAGFSAADRKATDLLAHNKVWSGIKTNSFYQNLMVEIDPSKLDDGVATMDMWMALAFDYGAKSLDQGPKYKFAERETRRLATELGWKPHQVQAAIWTATKARIDAIRDDLRKKELKAGIGEISIKDGKEVYAYKKERTYDHFRLAHKLGMAYELTPEDVGQAKFDFSDAIRARTAQMSWEATPGKSTGVLPGIHAAPIDQKFEYLLAVHKALTDSEGRDLIAMRVGLPAGRTILGFSAWQGEIGAGAQTFTGVAMQGAGDKRNVTPEALRLLNLYAAVKGYVLNQEAVIWHVPAYDGALKNQNGYEGVFSRPLTEPEMMQLYSALHDRFNTWEIAPGYTENGFRVLNFAIDNKDFQKGVVQVLEGLPEDFGGGMLEGHAYRSIGDYISNDWSEAPNGEQYVRQIEGATDEGGGSEGSDLQGWASDLRARVAAVNEEFARDYGWDESGSGQAEVVASAPRSDAAAAVQDLKHRRRKAEARTSEQDADDVKQSAARLPADLEPGLIGLPARVEIPGHGTITTGRLKTAADLARRYMREAGMEYQPPVIYAKVDPERAKRIAKAYEEMEHAPRDPQVRRAYDALVRETKAQYKAVLDSGLRVEFIDLDKGDPYAASPRLMTEDVRENNHMWVFSTRDGFGSSDFDPEDNPLLAETEFEISGKKALVNDLFRVVHDYFGHVKEGLGFRADGEENSWRAHSAMFSPLARKALTTETRGQNSWVNYGPKGESNRKASSAETVYADQKTGLLPDWVVEDGAADQDVLRKAADLALKDAGLSITSKWTWEGDDEILSTEFTIDDNGEPLKLRAWFSLVPETNGRYVLQIEDEEGMDIDEIRRSAARGQDAKRPERAPSTRRLIQLRKDHSVLKSLLDCLAS